MKIIRKYLITNCKFWKLKSSTPYKDELTVFINVKVEILKEFSKEMPKKVRKTNKLIPEIKTKVSHDKNTRSVCPISGCIMSKRNIGTITIKLTKYL